MEICNGVCSLFVCLYVYLSASFILLHRQNWKFSMCVSVSLCSYSLIVRRIVCKRYDNNYEGSPDDGTCGVSKHDEVLIMREEYS
jgi:hypothetical protein